MLLYTYPENFRAYKALIAAQFSGANLKIAPNFVFGETNRSDAFLKKFPLGKVSVQNLRHVLHVIFTGYPQDLKRNF
jgi:Glutathione S-transferase, N-terminal domain